MKIGGLQKTSVIDFPGRLACTVFTVGCNFACPFCHNRELVSNEYVAEGRFVNRPYMEEDVFFEFLKKRKNILEGVCITGGEPTLQGDLVDFCRKIKAMGLAVKLDTNGSRPEVVKKLIGGASHASPLLDMIAMDVKSCFEDYENVSPRRCGANVLKKIKKSIRVIVESGIEYELRTTVVPGMHSKESLVKLATRLRQDFGEVNWVLQKFRASENCLDKRYRKMKSFSDEEMEGFLKGVREVLPKTKLK